MDTRQRDRTRLIYYLRVFDADTGRVLGHLIDLAPEGMMLKGDRQIEPKKTFSVRMDLPKNVMSEQHISFTVHSLWSRKEQGATHTTGFRIEEISRETLGIVRTLMEQFERDDAEDNPAEDMNPPLSG